MATKLSSFGQVQEEDVIICHFNGERQIYIAEEVLNPGTEQEEIIVNKEENKYFITSMALDGTSWAKDVKFIRT